MKDILFAFMICLAKNTQLPRRRTITEQHFKAWSLSDFCVSHQLRHATSLSFFHHTTETKRFEYPAGFLLKTVAQKKKGGGKGVAK